MKTYAPSLKGKVHKRGRQYIWSVRDANDVLIAGGEEYHLHYAFQAAHDTVFAIRTLVIFGRGDLVLKTKFLEFDFKPRSRSGSI